MRQNTRLALQTGLNQMIMRLVAGNRWPWILAPTIRALWRRLEHASACPAFKFLIDQVPEPPIWGGVGGDSYTGWVYQQGLFAALLWRYARRPSSVILDFGCGLGKLAPISPAFTNPEGRYVGLDIRPECIAFCRLHYARVSRVEFFCSLDYNATYSDPHFAPVPTGAAGLRAGGLNPAAVSGSIKGRHGQDWPVNDEGVDVALGISVFTHLREDDSVGYMDTIYRLLKPGGYGIFTMLLLNESRRRAFHEVPGERTRRVHDFNTSLSPSHMYFTSNPTRPEDAIAVSTEGLGVLVKGKLEIESIIWGSALGGEEAFPQDIVVLRKPDHARCPPASRHAVCADGQFG